MYYQHARNKLAMLKHGRNVPKHANNFLTCYRHLTFFLSDSKTFKPQAKTTLHFQAKHQNL